MRSSARHKTKERKKKKTKQIKKRNLKINKLGFRFVAIKICF